MAIVKCAECGTDVSTSANACPNCGAPSKVFMGKPSGFKDFFSEKRLDAAKSQAKADKEKRKGGFLGCLGTIFMIVILLFLAALIF